jgi:hypothetical protein
MSEKIITSAPTEDEVLTASLKLIVDRFVDMGYEENIIFGKVNLILNNFITPEGGFTPEYIELATNALKMRASKEFEQALMEPERPTNDGSGISLIVPGGGIGGKL